MRPRGTIIARRKRQQRAGRQSHAEQAGPPGPATTLVLLALSVVLTVVVHPPSSRWSLTFVALAPLVAAVEGGSARRGFALCYLHSIAMGLVLARWVVHALAVQYQVPRAAAWLVLSGIVFGLALFPASATALYARLRPRVSLAFAPLLFAALWVLAEWLRSVPLGLPWILSGLTVHRFPLALQTADLGGVWAVGFAVVTSAAGVGVASRWRRAAPLVPALAVLAVTGTYGAWRLASVGDGTQPSVRVGLVQASLEPNQRFLAGSAGPNVQRHLELSRELAGRHPLDLLVWAETAVDTDLDRAPALRAELTEFTARTGIPLVTGAPRSASGSPTNSVVLFTPKQGLAESYAKQRLVPFSEYNPPLARLLAPLLGPVMQGLPYQAGREATVFRAGPLSFSAPVCFEITYPDMVRAFRRQGAQLLLNLSNDAWFGRTGYAEMHFAHAVLRAIETRSWVVRAANTGISGLVDPAGRVVAELPIFEEGSLVGRVRPAGPLPFYGRVGDAPVVLCLLALVAAAWVRKPRRSRPSP